jgi:hypothetical protein
MELLAKLMESKEGAENSKSAFSKPKYLRKKVRIMRMLVIVGIAVILISILYFPFLSTFIIVRIMKMKSPATVITIQSPKRLN